MKKQESGRGLDIYECLKKNSNTTRIVTIVSGVVCCFALIFSYYIYKESEKRVFAIDETGNFIPLSKLEDKEGRLIEVKSNIKYFIDNYYTLNANNIKQKKEVLLWLIGESPKVIIQNRINSGYFDDFVSINGLTQIGIIDERTFNIVRSNEPYIVACEVLIKRINGTESRFYKSKLYFQLESVNRNYPYNPFGLLITQFKEDIQEVSVSDEREKMNLLEEQDKANEEELNQFK